MERSSIKMIPCPFCGYDDSKEGNFNLVTFKRDRKKRLGLYHEICTIKCGGCTCNISQAGITKDNAFENAVATWNSRATTP